MRISVVAAAREDDRPAAEALAVASEADRLGYGEVWLGEGPTWDAFVLAAAVGGQTRDIALTAGPVPVSVRDPETIVRGAASAQATTGRPVGVALGTSSVRVVEGVHGRDRSHALRDLAQCAREIRPFFGRGGQQWPDGLEAVNGFRRRLTPPAGQLTVAAFGDRAVRVAAEYGDRMLLDLVTPVQVRALRSKLDAAAGELGRTPPLLAAWLPAAVDPNRDSLQQVLDSMVGYFTVRGYAEVFIEAGLGDVVSKARAGAPAEQLVEEIPLEVAETVGLVGSRHAIPERLQEYADAGLDEVALVPATAGDPAGTRTLSEIAALREGYSDRW